MPELPLKPIVISTGTLVRAVLVVLFFAFLFFMRDLALVLLTAVVIASAIEPLTLWIRRLGLSRLIAVLCIYFALALAFIGVFYFFVPSLLSDAASFLGALPRYIESVPSGFPFEPQTIEKKAQFAEDIYQGIREGTVVVGELNDVSSFSAIFTDLSQILKSFSKGFWDTVSVFFGGILSFLLIIVLSFYLAVQEDGIGKFLRVVTPERYESYIIDLWKRSQRKIGYWFQGQILLAALVGVLVYLGLMVLGVKNALFLAVLAAILEIIPLFGPILSAIPAVALAASTGGISLVLLVVGLYLIIQQFENHLIYPLVVKKIVGVSPLLVILALIIGAKLAGFLGILLSVPVAATLMEYFDDVQRRKAATQT